MLVDNGIGIYKTDKNSIPKIIELRMVYILYVVAIRLSQEFTLLV